MRRFRDLCTGNPPDKTPRCNRRSTRMAQRNDSIEECTSVVRDREGRILNRTDRSGRTRLHRTCCRTRRSCSGFGSGRCRRQGIPQECSKKSPDYNREFRCSNFGRPGSRDHHPNWGSTPGRRRRSAGKRRWGWSKRRTGRGLRWSSRCIDRRGSIDQWAGVEA